MEELRWTADDQLAAGLDRPILVVAFRGLFDAAGSATSAVEWLAERLGSVQVGDVDLLALGEDHDLDRLTQPLGE